MSRSVEPKSPFTFFIQFCPHSYMEWILFPFCRLRCKQLNDSSSFPWQVWDAVLQAILPLCQCQHGDSGSSLSCGVMFQGTGIAIILLNYPGVLFLKKQFYLIYSFGILYCLGSGQEHEKDNSLSFAFGDYQKTVWILPITLTNVISGEDAQLFSL